VGEEREGSAPADRAASGPSVEEHDRFLALNDRVFALYGEERFGEALALVEDAEPSLPGWRSRTTYWRACLECLVGRPDSALGALQWGLEAGLWWRPDWLVTDHDLEPLWNRAGFKEVVAESERRQHAANAHRPERPEVLLLPPNGEPRGLLVALHMYGTTARRSAPFWRPAAEDGYVVCLPESTTVQADGLPCWDDDTAADRDVALAIEGAKEAYALGGRPVVLAGASQGGVRAAEMALRGRPVASRAFIGVVSGLADPDLIEGTVGGAADRGLRAWLLTGQRDAARQAVETFHAQLSGHGIPCRLDVLDDLGHTFPDDFGERLRAVLPSLA
jgi:predicted esterase